ncbi:MAG: tetratricopeptide repeat protein [Arenimonas sp.]
MQPNEIKAYLNRASAYIELGKLNEARNDYTSVIRINPKFANIYAMRGKVSFQMKSWDAALSDFRLAVAANPNDQESKEKIAGILKDHPVP